jgi:hypothetical protein
MTEPIKQILEFLQKIIDDTDSRLTGRASILDYGMRVRRQTAEEIFRHIQSLVGTKSATRTGPSASPAITPYAGVEIELGLRDGPSAGAGNLHAAATRADTRAGVTH